MKGLNTNAYAAGAVMTLIGGSSLAEVSVSNQIGFWISTFVFSIGIAICVYEFLRK